ncbi:hypothetical protein CDD83_660 [Cordyceps sp. RAO-2017]|nr:hypothetical protein CDD83_660 [Cordyceps sp. RAO-2017]
MADVEEVQFNSLADRIAALNKQKNFNTLEPARKRPPPPPPPAARASPASDAHDASTHQTSHLVPPRPARANPPPLPRRDTQASVASSDGSAVPPPLPSRPPSSRPTPPLLPRRTSTQSQSSLVTLRRNSGSSDASQRSSISSMSLGTASSSKGRHGSYGAAQQQRKLAPAVCDPASLPPLPPSRRESQALKAQDAAEKRANKRGLPAGPSSPLPPPTPSLPPRLPSRPARSPHPPAITETEPEPAQPRPRKLPSVPIRGFSSGTATPPRPPVPNGHSTATADVDDGAPPPIPVTSRPSAAQIDAVSAKAAASPQPLNECWICRDWSGPDGVAAQFPRDRLPRSDPVGYLARGLCDPFPSYTDKARAIFTWFHHNIYYDTVAFFGNNVRSMTVEETIFSGKAVCQGYAETYKAIANRAGLDCIVVVGHGKGFGHVALKKGERPPPPKPDGHAWNAVRIDGGGWKLIDACWGAGHLCGSSNQYKQEFTPSQFTKSNEKFGLRHFPREPSHQFRSDGRTVSWEEYFRGPIDGDPPVFYTNGHQEGIAEDSVEPKERDIAVYSGQVVRFQFSKICEHWTSEANGLGKPPLLLLSIHGADGRKEEMVPMETNGYWHWLDINARDLGAPGQSVEVAQLTTMGDRDGRGVSASEYLSKKGKVGMSWSYVVKWELV